MAILTGIGTSLKGSAGAWTYNKRGGLTIAKQKVDTKGQSPRTYAQMRRRVQWGNLVNIWQAFRDANKPSFENADRLRSDFNLFIRANIGSGGVYLKKDEVRFGGAVVSDYLVTEGSLQSIGMDENGSGVLVSDIDLGNVSIGSSTTLAALSTAIINNNGGKFMDGDKITCFILKQITDASTGVATVQLLRSDIILDTTDSDTLVRDTATAACFSNVGTKLGLSGTVNGGAVYIHSRKSGAKTLVSTQRIVVTNSMLATYQTTTALNSAIVSYGGSLEVPYLTPDVNDIEAPVVNP